MRHVAQIMGMPISLDIPRTSTAELHAAVFKMLRDIEDQFSPYKPTSEVCKLQAGEIAASAVSADMQEIMTLCDQYHLHTDGYFSAYFNGQFNPTGIVKGWAIDRCARWLRLHGCNVFLLNAGGDLLAQTNGEHVWVLGLQHPTEKGSIMGHIKTNQTLALATSGSYERGEHIFNPHTQKPTSVLASVTIIGPDIIPADVYATTVYAMGLQRGLEFIGSQARYEALCVTSDLSAHPSEHFF